MILFPPVVTWGVQSPLHFSCSRLHAQVKCQFVHSSAHTRECAAVRAALLHATPIFWLFSDRRKLENAKVVILLNFVFFLPSFSKPRTDGRRLTLAWADSHNSGPNISLSNTPRFSSSHRFNPFLATLSWPIPYLLLTQGPVLGRYGCQLWRRFILR